MGITINQTYARIGIETTPAQVKMESNEARLNLHQAYAKINIHTELPRVQIDQYECFASAGLKNDIDRAKEISARAYQQVMDYIAKTAEDGERLAAIENGGNPIAEISAENAWTEHEFGYDYIPKVGPKITVTGSVKFDQDTDNNGSTHSIEGEFVPGYLNVDYLPGNVKIYMQQYASINVAYQPENTIDRYI